MASTTLSVPKNITYTTMSPFSVQLHIEAGVDKQQDVTLKLPSEVASDQSGVMDHPGPSADHISIRLRGPSCRPAPATFALPRTYLSAAHLESQSPAHLTCSRCTSPIIDCSGSATYTALPSEHWEELIDSWMCHGDQLLNASVTRGKEGLEDGSRLKVGEVRVADGYLICSADMMIEDAAIVSDSSQVSSSSGLSLLP